MSGGLLTTAVAGQSVEGALVQAAQARSDDLAGDLARELRPLMTSGQADRVSALIRSEAGHVGFIFVVLPEGRVLGGGPPVVLRAARSKGRRVPPSYREMAVSSHELGTGMGRLWVGLPLARARRAAREVEHQLALATAAASVIGVLLVGLLSALFARPIHSLAETAERMGRGELYARAAVVGGDELAHLAEAFNRMAAQLSERIGQAEELRRYFEEVFEHVPVGLVVAGEDWSVRYANSAIRSAFGEVDGKSWDASLGPEIPLSALTDAMASGQPARISHRSPTGRTYDVVATARRGETHDTIVTVADVTEVTELAQRVRQAERLAVAGEVAAGIVHAINNPLDGVMRALVLARRNPEDAERVTTMLDFASEGTDRIATVTRMLLDFARAEAGSAAQLVSPNALLQEAVQLVTLKADHAGIQIRVDLDPELPAVRVEPHGIIEALLNILLNGVDACGAGGSIVALTRRLADGKVEIAVSDDGPGIEAAHLAQIFEPFFTTKASGKGTGLGLSVARRIVHAYSGELLVESAPGEGATFRLRLPAEGGVS